MTRRRQTLVGLVAAVALLAGCAGDGGGSSGETTADRTGDVLTDLADLVIVPAYEALVEELDALGAAVDALCAAPSPAGLDAARRSWRDASLAWNRTRPGGVGPAMERRLLGAVAFEARPDTVERLLAGTEPVDATALDAMGSAVRGLPAIEQALFGEASAQLTGSGGERRCRYASAATALSSAASAEVLADWSGTAGHRATVADDPQASLAELVNEVGARLREADERGLRTLVVAGSPAGLDDDEGDGPAAFALAQVRAVVEGAAALLEGPEGAGGIAELVADGDEDAAARLQVAAEGARTALAVLPDAAAEAFADPVALAAAADAVAELRVLVTTEVASRLGVTMGFGDADGDS